MRSTVMRVAIISDIHDNLVNLEKCLAWCSQEEINRLICCGDVTNSETLGILAKQFAKAIYLVRGNMEIYGEEEVKQYNNIEYLSRSGGKVKLDKKDIGVCHEPYLIDKVLELGKFDIIFYGHTHKPWIESKSCVTVVNPGTLGGVFQKATFAVWNTNEDEPELKLV